VRSASVRALRDSELLKIDRASFDSLLRSEPELALGLTRSLSAQLQASRAIPVSRRPRPVTIAMVAVGPGVPLLELADQLSRALCAWGSVAVLHPGDAQTAAADRAGADAAAPGGASSADALARFAPLVERCEQDHDQVIMVCGDGGGTGAWEEFCASRADRVLAVVRGPVPAEMESGEAARRLMRLRGSDLLAFGVTPGAGGLAGWMERLAPTGVFTVADGTRRRGDVARAARRLSGRSVGAVLAGGGARALAHLGVLEVLLESGLVIDRVAGVSMGSFIGGLLAAGHDSATIDAYCYEEWVRRNPINDYTVPRHGLIRGHKAEAMLERVFGDVRVEELPRSFYCASVNLRGGSLVIEREGPMVLAVGASMSLPLIAPPIRRDGALLIDGSLLDNLPIAPMSASGEGPVLAIDIKAGEERAPRPGDGSAPQPTRPPRLPLLTETMARIALLSSANTDEAARRHADMTIPVRVPGVGLLEFHQIDVARAAGRRAGLAALEAEHPAWLTAAEPASASVAGRRTVMRV
jgi:NTE family protein